MEIELDILNHVETLRMGEVMALKGISGVTVWNLKKTDVWNWTANGLVINDEKFKNWKRKKYTYKGKVKNG